MIYNRLEPLFAYIAIGIYLLAFVPCSLYTLFKLGNKFPYMKSYICSVFLSAVFLIAYVATLVMKFYRCSSIIKNIPFEM